MGSNWQDRRRLRAPPVFAILAAALPFITSAQPASELYLLEVRASGTLLERSLPAYAADDVFYIELGALTTSLEFPIARTGDAWSGWFYREDRSFDWLMAAGQVEIAGREPALIDEAAWFELDGEVFVAESVIEDWFSLELESDSRQLVLNVKAAEALPFEQWDERTQAKYRYRLAQTIEPDVVVDDQYKWITPPQVNFDSHAITVSNNSDRYRSQSTSIVAGMDLLKHSAVLAGSFTRSDQGPSDSSQRLTIERYSETPSSPIFGDIHHYAFGDLFQASPNLVTAANTGRGFVFERYAEDFTGSLSSVNIAADAPPGWEVELYRDGNLIDFATVDADGRYIFSDQEIYFGENEFVARLYGPQGQVREDRRTYFGGGIELDPGDYDYSISHIDFTEDFLGSLPAQPGNLRSSYATDLRYSRAVSKELEVGAAFSRAGLASDVLPGGFYDQSYLSVFSRARLGPGVLMVEAADQQSAGHALNLEYLTGIGGKTISFLNRQYDNFDSPATVQSEALDGMTEVSILGRFGSTQNNAYRAGVRRRDKRNGGSDYRLFSRVGTRVGPLSLTNELEYRVADADRLALGSVRLAARVHRLTIRGQVDYSLSGQSLIRQVSTSLNWDASARLNNNLTISRSFDSLGGIFVANTVSVRIRDYDLSFGVTSDFERDWSVAAGVSFSFGYNARRGSFVTDHKPLAHTGRATMNLFVDGNNNGVRDPGERPVEPAEYRSSIAADIGSGAVVLTAVPATTAFQIDTSRFRFDDPFMAPRLQMYEVRTHVGSDIEIDIAVVMTGDIEGTVIDTEGRPQRGVELLLLDAEGREVGTARSEFDGYFSFVGIPGGEYLLSRRMADESLETLQQVELDAELGWLTTPDVVVARAALTGTSP